MPAPWGHQSKILGEHLVRPPFCFEAPRAIQMYRHKGLFINDVIIFGKYPRFSLQTTHVLREYNVLLIHGWSGVKPD